MPTHRKTPMHKAASLFFNHVLILPFETHNNLTIFFSESHPIKVPMFSQQVAKPNLNVS